MKAPFGLACLCLLAAMMPASVGAREDRSPPRSTPGLPPRFLGPTAIGDFNGRVRSMQELKFAGVVRQQYDFSCGSAALATLLQFYGDRSGEVATFRGMWAGGDHAQIRKLGFSLLDMKRYLTARGRVGNGYKVSLADIEKAGVPGIALITVSGYRHFVVIQGVRNREVLVGDPSLGLRVESAAIFEKSWNGVIFALDAAPPVGATAFNAPQRWVAFARAPVGSRYADPLSLQALSLTAPFYRDF